MSTIRQPVLSGSWYPADPTDLAAAADGYLSGADLSIRPAGRPLVAVVPHAGYVYSGSTAGKLLGLLRESPPRRIILLAPNHRVALDRIALSGAWAFATPLGTVGVDQAAVEQLAENISFTTNDRAHAKEHAIEIQLPLIQRTWPDAVPLIVPLLVPALSNDQRREAAAALAKLATEDTLFLVSTDFTHYGASYGYVPFTENLPTALEELDSGAILRILAADAAGLLEYGRSTGITMCGLEATAVTLGQDLPEGYEGALIDYTRSGDRDGDYSLSVSYASILLCSGPEGRLNDKEKQFLKGVARQSVEAAVKNQSVKDSLTLATEAGIDLSASLVSHRGAFVTLTIAGQLRGCIGYIEGIKPLVDAVAENGRSAAVGDPRFNPVAVDELARLEIEVSALTPLVPIAGPGEIVIGRHGVVLAKGGRRAVFLPQVATEQDWDRDTMLTHLALKAGLDPDGWREGAEFLVFEADVF
ncbi:MAG: AmmeMemoRadiSam system protein B [Candidatus Krumholzibacteria bacterium]|nr:AmmeMemoRadiSam system protein B [Candidatus Krumholzibacteria bacterium]